MIYAKNDNLYRNNTRANKIENLTHSRLKLYFFNVVVNSGRAVAIFASGSSFSKQKVQTINLKECRLNFNFSLLSYLSDTVFVYITRRCPVCENSHRHYC